MSDKNYFADLLRQAATLTWGKNIAGETLTAITRSQAGRAADEIDRLAAEIERMRGGEGGRTMNDQDPSYDRAHRKLKRQVRNKHEEVKRLRELLAMVYDSIDNHEEPDPGDSTRQWNSEFKAYHRGCVLFNGAMTLEEWRELSEAANTAKENTNE